MTQRLQQAGRALAAAVLASTFTVASAATGSAQASAPQVGGATAPVPMPGGPATPASAAVSTTPTADPNAPPPGYVIGADDVLTIRVWQDEKMSGDVLVRPDGKVTLALVNDIQAAGLTPDQFRLALTAAAEKFIEGPTVNVTVKQINSRRIYVQGAVNKPGPYQLSGRMDVLQMLAMAGGLTEYADKGNIGIFRTENGKQVRYRFNWDEVNDGKRLQQNIELKVGDTIVVKE
jgi:polysaccharide export outer membrane protein